MFTISLDRKVIFLNLVRGAREMREAGARAIKRHIGLATSVTRSTNNGRILKSMPGAVRRRTGDERTRVVKRGTSIVRDRGAVKWRTGDERTRIERGMSVRRDRGAVKWRTGDGRTRAVDLGTSI